MTLTGVILPVVTPAFLAGSAPGFARSLGECGAMVFIAGNQPFRTEIVPLLAFVRLEEFDYPAAAALAVTTLAVAFVVLLLVNAVRLAKRASSPMAEGRVAWATVQGRAPS